MINHVAGTSHPDTGKLGASTKEPSFQCCYLAPEAGRMLLLALFLTASIAAQIINPLIMRHFIDAAEAQRPLLILTRAALLFLGLALLFQVTAVAETYVAELVGWRVTNQMRSDLTRHCLSLDMSFHKTHLPGEMIERIDGDVSTLSNRSRFWKDTAIFVIEDDAQNGPDHVDAHRTVGLVISPCVKRNAVDSTMYTTTSMVRTMELILSLPPMTQYDQNATSMLGCFTSAPDLTAYADIKPQVDLEAKNPATGAGAAASAQLDLSGPDRANPDSLNAILWHALKPGIKMPAPVRSARLLR